MPYLDKKNTTTQYFLFLKFNSFYHEILLKKYLKQNNLKQIKIISLENKLPKNNSIEIINYDDFIKKPPKENQKINLISIVYNRKIHQRTDNFLSFLTRGFTFLVKPFIKKKIYFYSFKQTNTFSLYRYNRILLRKKINSKAKLFKKIELARKSTFGSNGNHQNQTIQTLLKTKNLKEEIKEQAARKTTSFKKTKQEAQKYLKEIATDYDHRTIKKLDIALSWLWNRFYQGVKINTNQKINKLTLANYNIIYLPCHRSHIDYLLLSYVLYYQGLIPPHIAAGVNLDFWPAGKIFRKSGAFFIRRTFANKLYSASFFSYLEFLLKQKYPIEFFIEGGRSRDGLLSTAKTGMLSMILQAHSKMSCNKPLALVPIYLGYENIIETNSYIKEIQGKKKEKENAFLVFKTFLKLKNLGKSYVNFADPIFLKSKDIDFNKKNDFLEKISFEIMHRINDSCAINSTNLLALILQKNKILEEDELIELIDFYIDLQKTAPILNKITYSNKSSKRILERALYMKKITKITKNNSIFYQTHENSVNLANYYSNNVLHSFIFHAILAKFILKKEEISLNNKLLVFLIDFLNFSYFLKIKTNLNNNKILKIKCYLETHTLTKLNSLAILSENFLFKTFILLENISSDSFLENKKNIEKFFKNKNISDNFFQKSITTSSIKFIQNKIENIDPKELTFLKINTNNLLENKATIK